MSNFLFLSLPAWGHFGPMARVASALGARGHKIAFASGAAVGEEAQMRGFDFHGVGPSGRWEEIPPRWLKPLMKKRGVAEWQALFGWMLDEAPEMVKGFISVMARYGPDVLVVDVGCYPGLIAAEVAGGVPWVASSPFPGIYNHQDYPPYSGFGMSYKPTWVRRQLWQLVWLILHAAARRNDRTFNRIRAEYGLPPQRNNLIRLLQSPYLTLAYGHPVLEYGRTEWLDNMHLVGPCVWDRGDVQPLSDELLKWMEADRARPLFYVTMGTIFGYKRRQLWRDLESAIRKGGYRAIFTYGYDITREGLRSDEAIYRADFVPQSLLLPKVQAAIHHAGFGTNLGVLLAGLPSVLIPLSLDQNENAQRTVTTGAGLRVREWRRNETSILKAARRLLTEPSYAENARRVSDVLKATDAVGQSVALLERVAATGQPVLRPEFKTPSAWFKENLDRLRGGTT